MSIIASPLHIIYSKRTLFKIGDGADLLFAYPITPIHYILKLKTYAFFRCLCLYEGDIISAPLTGRRPWNLKSYSILTLRRFLLIPISILTVSIFYVVHFFHSLPYFRWGANALVLRLSPVPILSILSSSSSLVPYYVVIVVWGGDLERNSCLPVVEAGPHTTTSPLNFPGTFSQRINLEPITGTGPFPCSSSPSSVFF